MRALGKEIQKALINQKANIEKVTKNHFTIVIARIYEEFKFEFYIRMTMPVMRTEKTMSLIYSSDNLNIIVTELLSCTSSPIP